MRGSPIHGFRLTRGRIARGVTSRRLMTALKAIEKAEKDGKSLSPSLLQAHQEIQRNRKRVARKGLLSLSVDRLHAVDKSAIRRDALLRLHTSS